MGNCKNINFPLNHLIHRLWRPTSFNTLRLAEVSQVMTTHSDNGCPSGVRDTVRPYTVAVSRPDPNLLEVVRIKILSPIRFVTAGYFQNCESL